jgi:hypothetical protein
VYWGVKLRGSKGCNLVDFSSGQRAFLVLPPPVADQTDKRNMNEQD